MAIVFRNTKGSALTHAELDGNFSDLNSRISTRVDSSTIISLIKANSIDSERTSNLINETYIQTRQAPVRTAEFVTNLIDSDYVSLRSIDSDKAIKLIDQFSIDSTGTINLIDSAYVLARAPAQDFLDSAEAIALIDSAYVQARQVDLQRDSAFITNIIDSAYIQTKQADLQRDSGFITEIIDSAYVAARAPAEDFTNISGSSIDYDSASLGKTTIQSTGNIGVFTSSVASKAYLKIIDSATGNTLGFDPNEIAAASSGGGAQSLSISASSVSFRPGNSFTDAFASFSSITGSHLYYMAGGASSKRLSTTSGGITINGTLNTHTIPGGTGTIALTSDINTYDSAAAIQAVTNNNLDMGSNNITTTGKILFSNVYNDSSDLPNATTYHGMFAHVHNTGAGYFAHAGNWVKLANNSELSSYLPSAALVPAIDAHLNQSNPTSGYVLSWNGSDYQWVSNVVGTGLDSGNTITLIDQYALDSGRATSLIDSAYVAARTGSATAARANAVYVDESEDDNVNYNVIFENTSPSGDTYSQMQVDNQGLTFNPFANRLTSFGTLRARSSPSTTGGLLELQTADTSINDGDQLGTIRFQAPLEASGGAAIETAAEITAEADATWVSNLNSTDLVFKLGSSGAATEKARLTHEGNFSATSFSGDGSALTGITAGIDSAATIALIDSAYVQARQIDSQRDSAFVTGIVDSTYIRLRQNNYLDSNQAINLIDSSYVQARQAAGSGVTIQDEGSSLSTLGTTLNFVGSGVVASGTGATKTITIAGGGGGTPGGSTTQVQFNDGGSFAGDAGLVYSKDSDKLTAVNLTVSGSLSTTTAGTPTVTSNGNLQLSVGASVVVQADSAGNGAGFRVGTRTTTQRNALSASDGEIVYNSTIGQFEIYQRNAWQPLTKGAAIFNVVNNGASDYTFTDAENHWFPSSENDPVLYLRRGETYYFIVNASGHPFQIRTGSGGSAYNTGVTNNGTQGGTIVFKVPMSAPATLYYQCTVHSGMGNTINIV